MSVAPRHTCAYPRCGVLVEAGRTRCRKHAQLGEQQRPNVDARRLYRTPAWRELRARVLREEPYCSECSADRLGHVPSVDVDHITPHGGNVGLFYDRHNLQSLCRAHHAQKTRRGE